MSARPFTRPGIMPKTLTYRRGKISVREIDKPFSLCYNSLEYRKGDRTMFQIAAMTTDRICDFVSVSSSFSIIPGI